MKRVCTCLLFFCLLLTYVLRPASGGCEEHNTLMIAPGVAERLAAIGTEFTLDWGLYQNT